MINRQLMCFINGHFHGTALMLDKWPVWLYPSVFPSIFTGFEEVLSVNSVKTASISDLVERLVCGHHIWDTYLTHILRIKNDKNKIPVPLKACFWSCTASFTFVWVMAWSEVFLALKLSNPFRFSMTRMPKKGKTIKYCFRGTWSNYYWALMYHSLL